MGNRNKILERCYHLDREVANEFRSCRQFLNGQVTKDNNQLMRDVLNRAIPYALANSPLMLGLVKIADGNRTNGTAKVNLPIDSPNWDAVQNIVKALSMRLDEGDILEYCLKFYIQEIKLKKCLP